MFEFNPAEHGVSVNIGLLRFDSFNSCKSCQGFGLVDGFQNQQKRSARFEVSAQGNEVFLVDHIGRNNQMGRLNLCRCDGLAAWTGNDMRFECAGGTKGPPNIIQHSIGIVGIVAANV